MATAYPFGGISNYQAPKKPVTRQNTSSYGTYTPGTVKGDYPFGTYANTSNKQEAGGLTSVGWLSGPLLANYRAMQAGANTPTPGAQMPTGPTGGSGGGRGGGGGGGGAAAAPTLSQAGFDALLAAINRRGPNYQFTNMADMGIEEWDPSLWNQMRGAIGQGYANANQQVGQGTDYVRNAMNQNWRDYGQLRNLAAPVIGQQLGQMMPGVATGGAADAALQGVNSETSAANAAFQRFLAANELTQAQAQGSRMNELELANQFYLNQLAQQRLADETGVGMQETAAQQAWRQRQNERQYGTALYNNQGLNAANQSNTQYEQQRIASTLDPIMQLIGLATEAGLPINPGMFA